MALVDLLLRCDRRAAPVFNFVQAAQAAAPNAAPSLHLRRSSGAPPTCRRRAAVTHCFCSCPSTLPHFGSAEFSCSETQRTTLRKTTMAMMAAKSAAAAAPACSHPRRGAMAKCGATRLFETVVSCHHVPTQSIPYSLQNHICIVPPLDLM